jgi:hypothetical protein
MSFYDSKSIIIGFGFKARRGKDTVANHIIAERGQNIDIRKYAFGDELRNEVLAGLFDIWVQNYPRLDYPKHSMYDLMRSNPNLTLEGAHKSLSTQPMRLLCAWAGVPYDEAAPVDDVYVHGKQRALYQWWGTAYRRSQDGFYWVNKLRARIEKEQPSVALITDMRFRNEYAYITSMGGKTVRLERFGFDIESANSKHVSEVELEALTRDQWDYTIAVQDGDLGGLKALGLETFDEIINSQHLDVDAILAAVGKAA